MTVDTSDGVKKAITRTRKKSVVSSETIEKIAAPSTSNKALQGAVLYFSEMIGKIEGLKKETEEWLKSIEETKEGWIKEKILHEQESEQKYKDLETIRKREEEEYEYQKMMERKKEEDEFIEKKIKWEKELKDRKEEIEADKKELTELREKVTSFDGELGKEVKEAQNLLTKELVGKFETEKKLREQEVRSERELLNLKIESLTKENVRQGQEIEVLKRAFDEATKQVKEIAVKVIEGGTKTQAVTE